MPVADEVKVKITADDRASGVLERFGLNLKTVATAAVGFFVVKLGKDAVDAARRFEKALSNVSTLISGDSTESMAQLSSGIKNIAAHVPKSPDELGLSAYDIFSAGITDTAKALDVLRKSADLAVAGLGTTKEATNLMTSSLNAFKSQGLDASKAADVLFKTVKVGKTTVAELAQSFGAVAPVAAAAGIKFEDLQAATAALTTVGLPASVAQTQLRASISSLIKPSEAMTAIYTRMGISGFGELLKKSGSLINAFEEIKKAVDNDTTSLASAFGSVEALNAVLSLTGEQGEAYASTIEDMIVGTDALGEAVDKQTQTFDAQVQILKNQWEILMVNAASTVLPTLTASLKFVNESINTVTESFKPLIEIVQNFTKRVMENEAVIFLMDQIRESFNQVRNVLVESLGPALAELWEATKPLKPYYEALAKVIGTVLVGSLTILVKGIATTIEVAVQILTAFVKLQTFMTTALTPVALGFVDALNGIANAFQRIIEFAARAMDAVSNFSRSVGGFFGGIGNSISGFVGNLGIPKLQFAEGGIVPGPIGMPQLAMVHGGETVLPTHRGGSFGSITINITGNSFLDRDAPEKMIEKMIDRLKLELRI